MSSGAVFPIKVIDIKTGVPIVGALVQCTSPINGDWQRTTNACGYLEPTVALAYGRYEAVISAWGYKPESRIWILGNPPFDTPEILVGLEVDQAAFPSYPTREQVCKTFCGFQGIDILTRQYGWIKAFGPEIGNLADDDVISYCQQMKHYGFTHVEFVISWRYDEPDYHYPVPGLDLSGNLDEMCRRIDLIIRQGMFIKFSLAGDGLSNGSPGNYGYNDPQGWTYGYEWLLENLGRIIFPLRSYNGHDLTRFIQFVPGYDGVFYGWTKVESPDLQPERVIKFGKLFRTILPDGYLGIEHTPGKIPVGEGSDNWKTGGVLDAYDTVYSEFNPFNLHSDDTWQIVGRLAKPYNRPDDEPANDDPHPNYYLFDCSRGKRFYILYELVTYLWVRDRITIAECNEIYDYFTAMAPADTLCMIRRAE